MFARSKLMGVTSASRFKSAKSCAGYSSSVCCFSSRLQRARQTYPTEDGSSPVLRSHCRRRTVQTEPTNSLTTKEIHESVPIFIRESELCSW